MNMGVFGDDEEETSGGGISQTVKGTTAPTTANPDTLADVANELKRLNLNLHGLNTLDTRLRGIEDQLYTTRNPVPPTQMPPIGSGRYNYSLFTQDRTPQETEGPRGSGQPRSREHSPASANRSGAPVLNHASDDESLQRDFEVLKDCLQRVKLPQDCKLVDTISKQGIKKDDQSTLSVISKGARYVETALKWMSTQDEQTPPNYSDLLTILMAHMQFLSAEYSALVVKGTFDQETAKIFKCLQKNTLSFRGDALQHLRDAAQIGAARAQVTPQNSGNYGNYGNRQRGQGQQNYGRGPPRYGNRDRGQYRQRDPYRNYYQQRPAPPSNQNQPRTQSQED